MIGSSMHTFRAMDTSNETKVLNEALALYKQMKLKEKTTPSLGVRTIGNLLRIIEAMQKEQIGFRNTVEFYQWQSIDLANTCLKLEAERDTLKSAASETSETFLTAYIELQKKVVDLTHVSETSLTKLRQQHDMAVQTLEHQILSLNLDLSERLTLENDLTVLNNERKQLLDNLSDLQGTILAMEQSVNESSTKPSNNKKNKTKTKRQSTNDTQIQEGRDSQCQTVLCYEEMGVQTSPETEAKAYCNAETQTQVPYPDWVYCTTDDEYT